MLDLMIEWWGRAKEEMRRVYKISGQIVLGGFALHMLAFVYAFLSW